jgi:maltose O-acetyltransferase
MEAYVNLTHKILRKVLRIPAYLTEKIDLYSKMEVCQAGKGARLYPASRVENSQSRRSAIAIGAHCHILGQLLVFRHGGTILIGESCFFGENSRIWSAHSIVIGNRVLISHNVNIHDNNSHSLSAAARHVHFNQIFSTGHPAVLLDVPSAPIVIEDDVWIGFNSTILKGVTIGKGAVVGAGSVVTKDVAAYTIVAGNPATAIGISKP